MPTPKLSSEWSPELPSSTGYLAAVSSVARQASLAAIREWITLLLQLVCQLAKAGVRTAYISGEESTDQVRMRAKRLGIGEAEVELATATNASDIAASMGGTNGPAVIVIDSIQTMFSPTLDSAPGTVPQVRASAQELIRTAKKNSAALLIVGHVTKDGAIAGPRVLEHMVDTVLYFEGDRSHHFRILRSVKNRFGATDEIGVFEMVEAGLAEVPNPSELFLADRRDDVTGAVVFAGIEGSRPLLVEIEALVAPSSLACQGAMSSAGIAAGWLC